MGIGYGSSFQPVALSGGRIGRPEGEKEEKSALLDILLILGEISSLAIPGVGEFISAGFAATQATKTTVEQIQSGNPNALTIGLSIGGALISAGSATSNMVKQLGAIKDLKAYELAERMATGREVMALNPGVELDVGKTAFTQASENANIFTKLSNTFENVGIEIGSTEGQTIAAFERFTDATKAATSTTSTATEAAIDEEELKKVLGKRDYKLFKELVVDIRRISKFAMRSRIKRFLNGLSLTKRNQLIRLARKTTNYRTPYRYIAKAAEVPGWGKYLTSARFYNREVQWWQNMNGSDAGRWLAEQGAQAIKSKAKNIGIRADKIPRKAWSALNKEQKALYGNYHKFYKAVKQMEAAEATGKTAFKNGMNKKWYTEILNKVQILGRETLKREQKVEKLFEEVGGTVIQSRYLLGYKIISSKGVGKLRQNYVQVSFRKWSTKSMTGKNVSGKAPVMIYASDKDLRHLVTEGSSYWFSVGQRKGWFMSRGGKAVGSSDVSVAISTILTFLPIQAIRSFGSIVSNVKAFGKLVSESTSFGDFVKSWEVEFSKALTSTGANRAGRLLAIHGIGRWAGHSVGRFVGKFSQQGITAAINAGKLSLTSKTGKSWAYYYKKQALGKGGFLSMRLQSEMKRGVLKSTGLRVPSMTGRRKLQITASARKWTGWK